MTVNPLLNTVVITIYKRAYGERVPTAASFPTTPSSCP